MDKVKAEQFIVCPVWVFQSCPNRNYLAVYMALRSFTGEDLKSFPSREKLAERAEVCLSVVAKALRFLQGIGAVTIEHQYKNNQQISSLYILRADRPENLADLTYADRRGVPGDTASRPVPAYTPSPVPAYTVGVYPDTHRTRTKELEPINYNQDKDGKPKPSNDFEEFLSQVRAAYPKRNGNYEWTRFSQRAKTAFKSKLSREQFLDAVRNYAKSAPDPQFTKMPSSFIAAHHDYIKPTQEQVASSKVIEIEDWKEIGA